jgi:poly(hydroxyalkanoate) depolymerase family esterase
MSDRELDLHARFRTLCLIAALLFAPAPAAAALSEVGEFGANPGNLKMFTFVPPALPSGAPLVVALHGCTQRAADYAADTGWIELAQRWGFALLLPEQRPANNPRLCFNWFNGFAFSDWWLWAEWGSDQDRDEGEARSIRQMIERMVADHGIDPRRIFITGLSAGAGMTAVMLAAYPEMFAAGAMLAGVPYRCARNAVEALTLCGVDLSHSGAGRILDLSPATLAARVFAASAHRGPWPRVSIWHGEADTTVSPDNARELLEQWTAVHGLGQTPQREQLLKGFRHREYRDADGVTRVETIAVAGMGHGVPVEPGSSADRCGRAGTHSFAVGLCASFYIGRFWGIVR